MVLLFMRPERMMFEQPVVSARSKSKAVKCEAYGARRLKKSDIRNFLQRRRSASVATRGLLPFRLISFGARRQRGEFDRRRAAGLFRIWPGMARSRPLR